MAEIGVQFGISIRVWLDYFPKATVYGIDIAHDHNITHPAFRFLMIDQGDSALLAKAFAGVPLRLVIDDGCHRAAHIQASMTGLWDHVEHGGLYIIEDVFALYHPFFASSVDGAGFLHQFVDDVNWRGKLFHGMPNPPDAVTLTKYESEIDFVHYYKGLVVIGKK